MSIMFDELFRRKTVDIQKAVLFGFVQSNGNYIYETDILNGSFLLQILITSDGNIDTKLTEKAIGDEYILYKTNAVGSFVGEVRKAIEAILIQVADKCYNTEIFKSAQAKEIICYVRENTATSLSFYGKSFPITQFGGERITKSGTELY